MHFPCAAASALPVAHAEFAQQDHRVADLCRFETSQHASLSSLSFLVDICRCVFGGSHVILWFVASIMTCFPFTMNVNPALGSLWMGNPPMTSIIVFGKAS